MTCHCGSCEDHRPDTSLLDFKEGTIFRCNELGFETEDINEVLDKVASTGFTDWIITRKSILYPEATLHVDRNMNMEINKEAPAYPEELAWETIKANRVEPSDIKWIPESDGRGRIKLLIVIRKGTVFLQVWEGENHVKEFKSGIGANEMAFFFEDMVIPFRDMFEELGFSVTEEISIE